MATENEIVAPPIFSNIKTDERVNSDLRDCLFCIVKTKRNYYGDEPVDYKIGLINLDSQSNFRKCPACNRVYICGDILGINPTSGIEVGYLLADKPSEEI